MLLWLHTGPGLPKRTTHYPGSSHAQDAAHGAAGLPQVHGLALCHPLASSSCTRAVSFILHVSLSVDAHIGARVHGLISTCLLSLNTKLDLVNHSEEKKTVIICSRCDEREQVCTLLLYVLSFKVQNSVRTPSR